MTRPLTPRILTDEEAAERDTANAEYWAAEDKRRQRVRDCPAHEWELDLYDPDDDVHVALRCLHCPADVNDVLSDGHELIYCEQIDTDNGVVTVSEGRHDSPVALVVPVDVRVEGFKSWTDYGWEYDVEFEVTQRGPARLPEWWDDEDEAPPDPPARPIVTLRPREEWL